MTTFALNGALDLHSTPAQFDRLPEQLSGTLDLSKVSRCDSAGLALLLECQRRAQGKLQLSGVSPQLRTLMDFYHVDELFGLGS